MAIYYFRNVGTAWNNNTSWSTTSSTGASAGAIPTAADNVIFDSGSANSCPVSTTDGVCLTFNSTSWTGTLTLDTSVTVSGNVTLSSNTTITGSSFFRINATASITSNSVTIPYFVLGSGTAMTLTLSGYLNVGIFELGGSGVINYNLLGNNLNVTGDVQRNLSSQGFLSGTTVVNLIGTSNVFDCGTTGAGILWYLPLTINTSGTVTFSDNFLFINNRLTHSAGTVNAFSTSFSFFGNVTANCENILFNTVNLTMNTSFTPNVPTLTLLNNLNVGTLNLIHNFTGAITINGLFTVFIGNRSGNIGSLIFLNTAGGSTVLGTSTLEFTGIGGVGYWTAGNGPFSTSPRVDLNITINTSGTLYIIEKTLSSTVRFFPNLAGGRTFRYRKGTVITRNITSSNAGTPQYQGSQLSVATTHTLIGMNNIAWGRIVFAGSGTFTMNELPQGSSTVITNMISSTAANYTITLTGNNRERFYNFLKIQRCTIAVASRRNTIVVTYREGNLGRNIGIIFGNSGANSTPKNLIPQSVYGIVGFLADPAISSR